MINEQKLDDGIEGKVCLVTGGSGFVGRRLVELLVEGGAKKVISLDLRNPDVAGDMNFISPEQEKKIEYATGNIVDADFVSKSFEGVEVAFHTAALVGPNFPFQAYYDVNVQGTKNILDACEKHGVRKLVASSSPSTRMDGTSINGKREEDLKIQEPGKFLQVYAETKAMSEMEIRKRNNPDGLMTVVIAPHQVYGPRDALFLPNMIYANKKGSLRVFGEGKNIVSFTHVDNYSNGLMNAVKYLYKGSPVLGNFYIITDGPPQIFWEMIDQAGMSIGLGSLFDKVKLPTWFMYGVAAMFEGLTAITGKKFRISNFTVKMLTINRHFDISNAERDMNYKPVISFEDGWKQTLQWFKDHQEWSDMVAQRYTKR